MWSERQRSKSCFHAADCPPQPNRNWQRAAGPGTTTRRGRRRRAGPQSNRGRVGGGDLGRPQPPSAPPPAPPRRPSPPPPRRPAAAPGPPPAAAPAAAASPRAPRRSSAPPRPKPQAPPALSRAVGTLSGRGGAMGAMEGFGLFGAGRCCGVPRPPAVVSGGHFSDCFPSRTFPACFVLVSASCFVFSACFFWPRELSSGVRKLDGHMIGILNGRYGGPTSF